MDRPALLAALRARVGRLERAGAAEALARTGEHAIPLAPGIDAALPGGDGLPRAALHEILAAGAGAAAGFAALLLARSGGTVFWIARRPDAWPPGLARFGLSPSRLVLVQAEAESDALWAMEEALRCPAVSGALLMHEASGRPPDGVAARRLQLAAETGGGIGLLLREDEDSPGPVLATTRWRISGRAGTGLSRHDLGDPQWCLELLRARGAKPASWNVTWRAGTETLVPEGMADHDAEEDGCDDAFAARLD
ncbi:ImuA family protein [Roseomonas sp. BN140053]|uniref:ImuA family protein n=1 Tax=Roseomonas sp. BN140053 TaxID=3391898 RepID=UPI0039E92E6F